MVPGVWMTDELEMIWKEKVLIAYSVVLVRERTTPTEQPLLFGEVSANFCV
jgi:hypothetical protein